MQTRQNDANSGLFSVRYPLLCKLADIYWTHKLCIYGTHRFGSTCGSHLNNQINLQHSSLMLNELSKCENQTLLNNIYRHTYQKYVTTLTIIFTEYKFYFTKTELISNKRSNQSKNNVCE